MLCLPVHMPTSQRVPPRAATGPDSSMIMLRFIFALAVHTATTSAATVSVKEGADESHRQLGASDCKQHVGQEQSERRIVLQLLRQPWKRRGQALVASGRKCQVRPGRPCLLRLLPVHDELQAARGPRPERRIVLQLLRQPWERRGQALEGWRKCQVPPGRHCLLRLLPVRRLPPGREEPGRRHQLVALPSSRAPTRAYVSLLHANVQAPWLCSGCPHAQGKPPQWCSIT